MKTLLFVVLLISVLAIPVLATDWITNPANGHEYALVYGPSWWDAEYQAESLGGHLATIRNQEENQWLFETFAYQDAIWFGLYQLPDSSNIPESWVWASGEHVQFFNWGGGTPCYTWPPQRYAAMYGHHAGEWDHYGEWTNYTESIPFSITGIAEIIPVPEPSSLLALGSLVAPLALLRRRRKG